MDASQKLPQQDWKEGAEIQALQQLILMTQQTRLKFTQVSLNP